MNKNITKTSTGEFKDDMKNLTNKTKMIVKKVRKRVMRNRNWFNLLFPVVERKTYESSFKDVNAKAKDKAKKEFDDDYVSVDKNGDVDKIFWFQDKSFYISPQFLVPNRYYQTDAIMANTAYIPSSKRPPYIRSDTYRKLLKLDDKIPIPSYRDDVAVYSSNTITYVCFKGTTFTKMMDWVDNWVNAVGLYRESDKYESHKQIIKDVQKKYPESRIRLVGHSRGGFYASTLAKDLKLKGSSFTGATTTLISKFTKNVKGFNFYVSDKFDVVSALRKNDKTNEVHVIGNIEGLDPHLMINYVPRKYWTKEDQQKYDKILQKRYINYLKGIENKTERENKILAVALETAKQITKSVAVGSFLAFVTGGSSIAMGGYAIGYDTIVKSGILYREVWNDKYNKQSKKSDD